MKLNAAIAKSLLMAASIGIVMPMLAAQSTTKPAAPATPKKEEPKAEAEPVVPGQVVDRKDGTFLSLSLDENRLKIAFYDAKKKPMTPDVARATARWQPKNTANEERTILNLTEDGLALRSPKYVRPPYIFKLYITLLSDKDEAVESFVIDFRG